MNSVLLYILKSTVCMSMLYLMFRLLMRKETSFRVNRLTLLLIVSASLVIPFLRMPQAIQTPVHVDLVSEFTENRIPVQENAITEETNPQILQFQPETLPEAKYPAVPAEIILRYIYLTGVLIAFLLLIRNIYLVLKLFRKARVIQKDGYRILIVDHDVPSFAFGRSIVIPQDDFDLHGSAIIAHEKAHIRLNHFYDLVLLEIVKIVHWFNPVIYSLIRELKEIHEFQADNSTLTSGIDAAKYQLLIIQKGVGREKFALANSFNHCQIKKRIVMMNKLKTGKAWRWKVATFLPVLALLLMAFGRTGENVPPEKENLPVNSLTEINQNQNEQKSRLIEVRKDGNYIDNKLYSLEEVVKKGKEWGKANNDWIQLRIDESVPYSRTDEILEQLSPGMYHITLSKVNSDEIVYFAGDVSQSAKFTQGKREDWMKARLNQIIGDKFSRYNIDYSFIVDRTGKVIDAHIVKPSEYSEVNSAYEKILTQMPNWEPAKRMGKSVSVYYVMRVGSIRFTPPKIKPNESQNSTTSGNSTDEVTANFTLGKEAYLKGSKFSQLNDSLLKMQKKGAADYKDSVAVRDSMNFWYKKANSSFAVVTRLTPDFAGGFLWKGRMANYLDLKAEKTEAKEAYEKALTILEKDVNKNKRSIIECYRYLAWYNFNNSERVSKFDKQQSDQYKNAAKDYYLKISALDPNDKQTKVIIEKLSKK